MKNTLVVLLYRGSPQYHPIYDIQFPLLFKTLSNIADSIDCLYLVDNCYNLSNGDMDKLNQLLPGKVIVKYVNHYSHSGALEMIVPIIREDKILVIDADMIIYNGDKIKECFANLDRYDVVSIFDSSGKILQYSVLEGQNRFAPYLFFIKRSRLIGTTLDFSANEIYTDSFSRITEELLGSGATALRLPDDRSSCLYDGNSEPDIYYYPECGYYHIRNLGGGLHLVSSYLADRESYERAKATTPKFEAGRLVMWVLTVQRLCNVLDYEKETLACLKDLGIADPEEYYRRFSNYHPWLNTL